MKVQNQEELEVWAGEYVLGTLNEADKKAFEDKLEQDPELQKMVNDLQAKFIHIYDHLPEELPSAALNPRIERSIDEIERVRYKQAQASHSTESSKDTFGWTGLWQNLTLWRSVATAFLLMSIILTANLQSTPSKPVFMAVLVQPQDKTPGWVIQATGRSQEIQLTPLGVIEIPEGKALQFWTKAEGWDAPVSLGLIKRGETLKIDLGELPPLQPNQLFELTLEQETGSPTGKPTGPIQSIGRGVTTL